MNPRRHTLIALLIIVAVITAVARFESMSEIRARITKRYSGPEKTSAQNDVGFSDAVRSAKLHKLRGNTSDDARAVAEKADPLAGGAPADAGEMPVLQQPAIGVADLLKHMAVMDAKIAAMEASAAQSVPAEIMAIAMPEDGAVVGDEDWYLRLYYDDVGSYDGSFAYWGKGDDISASFTGVAYVGGTIITGLDSNSDYPWVKIDVEAITATEMAGPAPAPFPANEEWYEKSKTAGDIHVTRF